MRFVIPNYCNTLTGVTQPMTGIGANWPPAVNTGMPFIRASDNDANGNEISVILTSAENAYGIYTRSVSNPDLWDPLLKSAVVNALAANFVNPINRDPALMNERIQVAVAVLKEARVANANEAIPTMDHEPDFMRIRSTGGAYYGAYALNGSIANPFGAQGWSSYDSWSAPDGLSY